MHSIRIPALVLLATGLALSALLARAGDETTPGERYEARLASLPAPGAAYGIDFEGQVFLSGTSVGSVTFQARAAAGPDGAPAWEIEESFDLAGGALTRTTTALLDRHLQPLRGRIEKTEPDLGSLDLVWERTETGFAWKRCVTKDGETKTDEETVEHQGTTTTTMTALWLFARMTLPEKGEYAVDFFNPDPDEGDEPFEVGTWKQGDKGMWDGHEALILAARTGDREIEAAFDPQDHSFLGARMTNEAKGTALEIRAVKAPPETEEDDIYARPAETAQEAALQAMMGFATADLPQIERVVDWPSVHSVEKAKYDARTADQEDAPPFPDVEAFQSTSMARFKGSLEGAPRPLIEMALKVAEGQLKTSTTDEGFTRVEFPPAFKNLVLIVGKVDGVWCLVRFPGRPD